MSSVRTRQENGTSPDSDAIAQGMYWASRMGHREAVELLLHSKDLPDSGMVHGQTPLAAATQCDHLQVVGLSLKKKGTNVNCRNWDGRTHLSIAARCGYLRIVRRLLDRKQIQPDISDFVGGLIYFGLLAVT